MVEPVRHRQTKGAATDMFGLQPLRHTPTLPEDLHAVERAAIQHHAAEAQIILRRRNQAGAAQFQPRRIGIIDAVSAIILQFQTAASVSG